MKTKPLISVSQAAIIIGCTKAHVCRLLCDKSIKGDKIGLRVWAVDPQSAERYAKIVQKTGRPRLGK